jgi:hypothetical protein
MKTMVGATLINQRTEEKQHGCPSGTGNYAHRNGVKDGASSVAFIRKQPTKRQVDIRVSPAIQRCIAARR